MSNYEKLAALALDLKRVAISYNRGSLKMSERFVQEAIKWKQKLDGANSPQYIRNILNNFENQISSKDIIQNAEYSLMYSTIIENYVIHSQKK